jgi:amidase
MDWKGSESLPIALSSDREQRPARLSYHLAFRRLLALATGVFFFVLYLQTPTICGKRPVRPFSLIATLPDLYEASVVELQAGMAAGHFTSVDLVRAYFARIDEVNLKGAALRAVLELNPSALFQAQVLDEERAMLGARGPLHGIPVLLKDNIATISSEGAYTRSRALITR